MDWSEARGSVEHSAVTTAIVHHVGGHELVSTPALQLVVWGVPLATLVHLKALVIVPTCWAIWWSLMASLVIFSRRLFILALTISSEVIIASRSKVTAPSRTFYFSFEFLMYFRLYMRLRTLYLISVFLNSLKMWSCKTPAMLSKSMLKSSCCRAFTIISLHFNLTVSIV